MFQIILLLVLMFQNDTFCHESMSEKLGKDSKLCECCKQHHLAVIKKYSSL